MSPQKDSARKEVEALIGQFKELAGQAEHISTKMTELAKKIAERQATAGKSSHELDTMPDQPSADAMERH